MNNVGIRADAMDEESFECFANELCSVLFNKQIHGFSRGTDDGIDGIDDVLNPTIIIQAKRWSPYRTSASKELDKEVKKIRNTIKSKHWQGKIRYVIVTSTGIPAKVQNKLRVENPDLFCDDDCIIDYARINELSKKPELEKVYSKNHLTGSNLVEVLKKDRLDSISNDYPEFDTNFFVETKFFDEAFNIVMDKHVLLVHGDPGVGKSTLCKMLGYVFANRLSVKQDCVKVVWRSPDEMSQVITQFDATFRGSDNQFFVVIDDFLGSNSLTTNSSEMEVLRRLLNRVKQNKNLYLVLNTRTQILESAKSDFQNFFADLKRGYKDAIEMIDMSDYTSLDKAKLLRKNLEREYSYQNENEKPIFEANYEKLRLPDDSDDSHSVEGKVYNQIINHRNFNPRLIEYIAQNFNAPSGILKLIHDTLDNPKYVYDPLFARMQSDEKWILFCLFTFNDRAIPENLLITAIRPFVQPTFDPRPVLKKFEHTWLRSEMEEIGTRKIGYANPGIRDYLSAKNEDIHFTNIITRKALLLRQLQDYLSRDDFDRIIVQRWDDFLDKDQYLGEYAAAYFSNGQETERALQILKTVLEDYKGKWHLDSSNGWAEVLLSLKEGPFDFVKTAFQTLTEENKNINHFSDIFSAQSYIEDFDAIVDLFLPEIIRKYKVNPANQDISDLSSGAKGYDLLETIFDNKKRLLQELINESCADYFLDVEDMMSNSEGEDYIAQELIKTILDDGGGERLGLYNQLFDVSRIDLNDVYDLEEIELLINDVKSEMDSDYYGERDQSKPNSSRVGANEDLKDVEQIANILDRPISNTSN